MNGIFHRSIAAAIVIAASVPAAYAESTKIDLGLSSSTSMVNLPCFIAQEGGFFEKEGLEVSFVDSNSGSKAAAAVIAGDVGIACTGGSYAIYAAMRGQSLRMVMPVLNQFTLALSIRSEAMEEYGIEEGMDSKAILEKLKGAQIGVSSPGSSTDQFARYLIGSAGMDSDSDFSIVPVGGDVLNVMAALERGVIQAATFSSPVPEWIEANGAGKTVVSLARGDVEALRGAYYVGLLVNEGYAEENPEIVEKAVAAIAEAQKLIRDNPDEAREIGARFLKEMDRQVYDTAFDSIRLAVPEEIKPMEADGVEKLITYTSEAEGETVEGVTFDKAATNQFLDAYLKR